MKQLTTSRRGQGTTNRPKETQPAGRTCVTWRPHYQDFKRLPREEEVAVLRTLLETFVSRAWCLRQHAGYPHVGWRNPVVGCERLPQARKRQREDGEADPLRGRAVRCGECAELAEEGANPSLTCADCLAGPAELRGGGAGVGVAFVGGGADDFLGDFRVETFAPTRGEGFLHPAIFAGMKGEHGYARAGIEIGRAHV